MSYPGALIEYDDGDAFDLCQRGCIDFEQVDIGKHGLGRELKFWAPIRGACRRYRLAHIIPTSNKWDWHEAPFPLLCRGLRLHPCPCRATHYVCVAAE